MPLRMETREELTLLLWRIWPCFLSPDPPPPAQNNQGHKNVTYKGRGTKNSIASEFVCHHNTTRKVKRQITIQNPIVRRLTRRHFETSRVFCLLCHIHAVIYCVLPFLFFSFHAVSHQRVRNDGGNRKEHVSSRAPRSTSRWGRGAQQRRSHLAQGFEKRQQLYGDQRNLGAVIHHQLRGRRLSGRATRVAEKRKRRMHFFFNLAFGNIKLRDRVRLRYLGTVDSLTRKTINGIL